MNGVHQLPAGVSWFRGSWLRGVCALRALWRWPERRDLFAPLDRFRARHRWPLVVYGLAFGTLDGIYHAPVLNLRCALLAVPVSFAADVLIVAAWWLFTRLPASRRSTALRR